MGCAASADASKKGKGKSQGQQSASRAEGQQQQQQPQQQTASSPPGPDHAAPNEPVSLNNSSAVPPQQPHPTDSPAFPRSPMSDHVEWKDDDGSSSDDAAVAAAAAAARQKKSRSKSVAVLEKISLSRSMHLDEDKDPFADVEKYDDGAGRESPQENTAVQSRTRRLSSVYNEFSSQVEAYLLKKAEGKGPSASSSKGAFSGSSSPPGNSPRESNGSASSDSDGESSRNEFLQRIFDLLDQEHRGFITVEMLRGGFRKMGYADSHERLNTMFACADKNHDGVLDPYEFFSFFKELSTQDLANGEEVDEDRVMETRRRSRAPSAFGVVLRNYKVTTLCGLRGRVKTVATSPFRPLFAACDRDDRAVHLFDFSGTQQKLLQGHRDSMLGVAFSPDRKHLASASRDATLVLWDCTVGHELGILQHPGVVTACVFTCDGRYIYTGCQDNLVRKYTVKKSRFVAVSERMPRSHLGVIVALGAQHHADEEIVISRSCDKCAMVLTSSLKLKKTLEGHQSMVWQASYNSDGNMLVTNCESLVKVWNSAYDCIAEFSSTQFHGIPGVVQNQRPRLWTTAQFCPPQFGPLLVIFNSDTNIFFVTVTTKKLLLHLNLKAAVYCACINDDMSAVICGDEAGNLSMIQLS